MYVYSEIGHLRRVIRESQMHTEVRAVTGWDELPNESSRGVFVEVRDAMR